MGNPTRRQIRQESLMKRKQRRGRFIASIVVLGIIGGTSLGTASASMASDAPVDESTAPVVQVETPVVDETTAEVPASEDTSSEAVVDTTQSAPQDVADEPQQTEPATQPDPAQAEPTQQSPPAEAKQPAASTPSNPVAKAAAAPVNYGTIGTLQPSSSDANKASYWKDRVPNALECYKYEGQAMQNNAHAYLTNNGKTVVLKPYGSDWPGDHWAALIVKASTWDAVTLNPTAGTSYAAYDNKEISHYIVCKGDTPEAKKDASASVSVTPATCTAPATLVYGDIVNATFSGTPNGTAGPGSYNVVATSTDATAHVFSNGQPTKTFSGTLDGKLPSQSTNPYKPCYEPPFNWDWKYPAPTCEGLTVTYPNGIPAGSDHKDVNIRVKNLTTGEVITLNFHDSDFTTTGKTVSYVLADHPLWPEWTYYEIQWTQVHGTNYHWEGHVKCGDKPPAKDASASVSVTPATCTSPEALVYGDIVNATFSGTANGTTGPGSYNVVATSVDAKEHVFSNGEPTKTFSGTLGDKLPTQSTNPHLPCYDKPNETVTGSLQFQTLSCVEGSKNWAEGDGVPGGVFVFTDKNGKTFTTEEGEGYSGGVPEGLAFGDITVQLKDNDSDDKYTVTPWSGTWTTVDPESLDCRVENASASVVVVTNETCDASSTVRAVVENATLVGTLSTEPGEHNATFKAATGSKFSNGTDTLQVPYVIKDALGYQSEDPDAPCYKEPPVLTPGDITAQCVSDVPWLAYDVTPEGVEGELPVNPLTITFVHPTDESQNYVITDLPLSGRILWPGAWDGSNGAPKEWPGWFSNGDGTYTATDGNFRWTREGVTVLFQVNPEYTTVVEYPAANSLCANPPTKTPEPEPTPTPTPTDTPKPTPTPTPVDTSKVTSGQYQTDDIFKDPSVGVPLMILGLGLLGFAAWGVTAVIRRRRNA